MKFMLDTNICIYIIHKKPPSVLENLKRHLASGICISTVTLAELEYGISRSTLQDKNRLALAQFLIPLEVADFNSAAAQNFGKIRVELEKKGPVIGAYDMMIAGHASAMKLTLVTNNVREFKRVPGLPVTNWV